VLLVHSGRRESCSLIGCLARRLSSAFAFAILTDGADNEACFFGWFSMPAALAAIGIATEHGFADTWILITIGAIGIVGTLYGYFSARRLLKAVLIYQGFVWVAGVCPSFLDGLPEVEQPRLSPNR
jgi:hypothetical protein